MATLKIKSAGIKNKPPIQIGTRVVNIGEGTQSYTIKKIDFKNTRPVYIDPEGDDILKIKIISKVHRGTLILNGTPIGVGDSFSVTEVVNGNLVYLTENVSKYYSTSFGFDLADEGSQAFSNLKGSIVFNVSRKENLPPITGDNRKDVKLGSAFVFEPSMLTTETTPNYQDPESDAPAFLRITKLPSAGVIKLNGNNVTAYQEIPFTEIASGNLAYYPYNVDSEKEVDFDFQIKDSGSGRYSSNG